MHIIPDEYHHHMDPAVDAVIDAMREIACDYPEADDDHILMYTILKLLLRVYTSGRPSDMISVLGVLEQVKQEYFDINKVHTSGIPAWSIEDNRT